MIHSKTRQAIMAYLKEYKRAHDGCSPSFQQIAEGCSLASVSIVSHHLHILHEQGLIYLPKDVVRSIEIVGGHWQMLDAAEADDFGTGGRYQTVCPKCGAQYLWCTKAAAIAIIMGGCSDCRARLSKGEANAPPAP